MAVQYHFQKADDGPAGLLNCDRKKKVRKLNFVIARLAILKMDVSTELWRLRIGCYTIPRKCKIRLKTLKQVPMNLVICLILFYLLVAEGIESNPEAQTGSTRGNSSPRGGPRGRGRNGRGSGPRIQQDPSDDAFVDTSVRNPPGLSNRVDPPYILRRTFRS